MGPTSCVRTRCRLIAVHCPTEAEGGRMKKGRKASLNGRGGANLDLSKPVKVTAAGALRTKSDVFSTIAEHVGINRREVAGVFHVMGGIIKADLSKGGPGVFKVPGLM